MRKFLNKPEPPPRKCVTCGRTLPKGVTYCVTCGTHDEADLDARVADLDRQVERSRQREYMRWLLSRMSFGLWRF
jgi:hypothetical protein